MSNGSSSPDGKGYLLATLAATLVMLVALVRNPLFALLVLPAGLPIVFIATFLPAAVIAKIGRHFRITSIFYFLASSVGVAIALEALVCAIAASQLGLPYLPPNRFIAVFTRYLPMFAIGALVGGGVYWLAAGRHPADKITG